MCEDRPPPPRSARRHLCKRAGQSEIDDRCNKQLRWPNVLRVEILNGNTAINVEANPPSSGGRAAKPMASVNRRGLTPEALERLVYMVGSPRSGTTVITRSFYLSERVFPCPSPTRFTHRVWRYRKKVDGRLLTEIFKMPKFYHERRALRTLPPADRANLERQIREAFESRHLSGMYRLYPLIYSLDPMAERSAENAVCWADKGNDVYGLFDVARYFPQAKFICIIRDPRATVASMKSQTVRSRGEQGSKKANLSALLASCIYWRNMMQNFLHLARRYPDRAMFLRYEDFVENPEETINRALEFATGERMSVEALQAGLSQFEHKQKHDRDAQGRKKPDQMSVGQGIDRRPLDRWRRMLDDDEILFTTAFTWRTARKLCYPIEPPKRRFAALRAVSRLRGWRKRAVCAAKLAYLELVERLVPYRPEPAAAATPGAM